MARNKSRVISAVIAAQRQLYGLRSTLLWVAGTVVVAALCIIIGIAIGLFDPWAPQTPRPRPEPPPPALPAPVTEWPPGALRPAAPAFPRIDTADVPELRPELPPALEPAFLPHGTLLPTLDETTVAGALPAGRPPDLDDPRTSFAQHLLSLRRQRADVALVIDGTLSMDAVIKSLAAQMPTLVAALEGALPGVRIAVVVYRDAGSPHPLEICPLTADAERLARFTSSLKTEPGTNAEGQGDWSEAVDQGLIAAAALDWRPDATRVLALVGDAPPHSDAILAARREALKFGRDGRRFMALQTGGPSAADFSSVAAVSEAERAAGVERGIADVESQARDAFRSLAADARGKYLVLADPKAIGPTLLASILATPDTESAMALWQAFAEETAAVETGEAKP